MTISEDRATRLAIDEINLADPDFWLRDDYHDALTVLREERPISWHEHPESGAGFWAFVDHADIAAVTQDWKNYSSKYGMRVHHDWGTGQLRPGTGVFIEMDPPEHTANRKNVSVGFTPRQIRRMDEYIRAQARRIVSRYSSGDEIDFVAEISADLPIQIVCDLMGVPDADRPYMLELSNKTVGDQDPEYGVSTDEGAHATRALREYGVALAAERRDNPEEDLISSIARFEVGGELCPPEMIGGYFALLVAAGNETTRTAISHGMHAFTLFPEERRRFLADPVGLQATAAEEIVRWATPVRHMGRVLEHDYEFKGFQMRKWQKAAVWYAASNRDPAIFENPFRFDIGRDPNPHQSFGAGGPHFCMGANLARREIWMLFQELFARFPESEVVGDPVKLRSIHVNGIKSMKVVLR
ncbi:linalool 8-monooxygenase [Sphaerisporangium siamense]|uniref:Cytochrome P450 n=1 Tax=Sphaerisporangium siamense TaxID=795645 RepID=A0A7W7GBG4_9ACTN|nr:cytochrome P450 [Sphaerisporangium siamense]MBB4703447.1 cytochrome P450 [Sphaerisporangium siamense]GII87559.1 linalool 8-monooxygenase [Sphaerisporangium siamense]